jgi:EmrB/QacA subfamily drug resistance transporter
MKQTSGPDPNSRPPRTAPPVDYSRKWYVMAAVGMGIFLSTIDGSIVNIALPTLVAAFNTDLAVVEWVVLAYLLTVAALMLSMGRLGDMVGKKPVYIAGFVVFTAGSALCGLAPTIDLLIAFRVLQAAGAAMVMALGMAIVTEAFPPMERGKAVGITGSLVSVGIVLGPTLGGLLIGALSWHWIFFVNLPVGVVGSLMALRFVPAIRHGGGESFDFLGAGTLLICLFSLLMALSMGQEVGFGQPAIILLFCSAVVFLGLFILGESRVRHPMIDLTLFRNALFSVNLVTGAATFVAMSGSILLMPFYLQGMRGYSPAQAGLLMVVTPLLTGVIAPISGSLSDRFGTRPVVVVGLASLVVGFLAVSTLGADTTPLGYVLRFLPVGVGIGVFQSPNNSAIMGTAPRHRLGVASGLLSLTRSVGQITGIATLGALWATRTAAYAGMPLAGDATIAPVEAQIAGLHDTILIGAVIVTGALVLGLWAFSQERRGRDKVAAAI